MSSCLLPAALIKSLRQQQKTSLCLNGADCTLFIANNNTAVQSLDAYMTPTVDLTFTEVATKVFVQWSENVYNLRKLGLYTEGTLPITAQFSYELSIPVGSYFKFTVAYPNGTDVNGIDNVDATDTDEFEIINSQTNGFLNTIVFPTYLIAPRRK